MVDPPPRVGDLVSIPPYPGANARVTALVVAAGQHDLTIEADGSPWLHCRWSPVDASWVPPEKVVVISRAYKKKQDISNKTT